MSLSLKNPNRDQFPPGGFGFIDPKTSMRFPGWEGTAEMTAQKVVDHRRANPNLYPVSDGAAFDLGAVLQEIYAQKFSSMPWLFNGGPPEPGTHEAAKAAESGHCICGESAVVPRYCLTCGGQKVVGTKCAACGAERS